MNLNRGRYETFNDVKSANIRPTNETLESSLYTRNQFQSLTSRKGNLKTHIDNVNNQLTPYTCRICDFTTSRKGNLKIHIDGKHLKL